MSYHFVEIELTNALPDLAADDGERGVALVVRRGGRACGFVLGRLPSCGALPAEALACVLRDALGEDVLRNGNGHEQRVGGSQAGKPALAAAGPWSPATAGTQPRAPAVAQPLAPGDWRALAVGGAPPLSVAVCTRNRVALLRRCLDHLCHAQRSQPGCAARFEILVVDNAPEDDATRKLAASLPGVRYLLEPRPGLDFARNRALAEASGELIAFVDDDVVVDRWWFEGLCEAWAEDPDAAAFTGPVLPWELETRAQVLFAENEGFGRRFRRIRFDAAAPPTPLFPVGARFGTGCNMVFRRAVLRAVGGFDEALDTGPPLPAGGDIDAFYRIARAGQVIVHSPRLLVFHHDRRTYAELRHQMWTWGLGFGAFAAKSYRGDPEMRPLWRRRIAGWFGDKGKQLVASAVGRHAYPPDLVLAGLLGGVVGLCGEYGRSRRRVACIGQRDGPPGVVADGAV